MGERDARLVERVLAGDDSAFDELVSRHRRHVCRAAAQLVGSQESADDLAQEALVRAYVTLSTLKRPELFGSWVVGIVKNLCLMNLRRERPIGRSDELPESIRTQSVPDIEDLLEGLLSLPIGTRQAADLYFLQNKPMADVGKILGISLSAVKSRIRDARKCLQKVDVNMKTKSKPERTEFDQELQRRLELARWYREFGKMAASGVPLVQILEALGNGKYRETVTIATAKLRRAVLDGSSMSDALRHLPALRTPETMSLVRAGEVGGIIDRTSEVLADWIDVGSAQREIELSFWLRTLGEMIDAGVPLDAALSWGIEYPANSILGDMLKQIAASTADGKSIAPIVRDAVDVLPDFVRLAFIAGESANCLGVALRWAGGELAAHVCARLMGPKASTVSNGSQEVFAHSIVRLLPGEKPRDRRAAIAMLGNLACAETADHVVPCLIDLDAEVRLAAIQALVKLRAVQFVPDIAACLNDSEVQVRHGAVLALGALGANEFASQLCALIRDPDVSTAKAAMDTLEAMGESEVLTTIAIQVLSDAPSKAMEFAVHILQIHPVPDAVPALIGALEHERSIAIKAACILSEFGRTEGVPILREALGMRLGITVSRAAEALEALQDRASAPIIREAVRAGRLGENWLGRADSLESR